MYVNEWMSYECSDEGTYTQNIYNSPTRFIHASKDENHTRNRNKICKFSLYPSMFLGCLASYKCADKISLIYLTNGKQTQASFEPYAICIMSVFRV